MMTPSFLAALVLMACGGGPSAPSAPQTPNPEAPPAEAPTEAPGDPNAGSCPWVITSNDATGIFTAARAIEKQGDCSFEDVQVEGSIATLSFDTKDGKKAPATLQPLACVKERAPTMVAKDPWILDIPEESKKLCPEGYQSIVEVMVTGKFPPPSSAM